jgi:hypothetical protein
MTKISTNNNTMTWFMILLLIVIVYLINHFTKFFTKFTEKFNQITDATITEAVGQKTFLCAKSCCFSGWPATIDIDESKYGVKPEDMGKIFRATNLRCNNGFTTGCVCEKM